MVINVFFRVARRNVRARADTGASRASSGGASSGSAVRAFLGSDEDEDEDARARDVQRCVVSVVSACLFRIAASGAEGVANQRRGDVARERVRRPLARPHVANHLVEIYPAQAIELATFAVFAR